MSGEVSAHETRVAIIYFDRARRPVQATLTYASRDADGGGTIAARVREFWPSVADSAEVYARRNAGAIATFDHADREGL